MNPTIAALRAVGAEATPGPWKRGTGVHDNVVVAEGDVEWVGVGGHRHDLPRDPVFAGQVSNRGGQHIADARAIVLDRNLSSLALDVIEAAWEYEYGDDDPDMQSWDLRAALDAYLTRAQEALDDR